MAKKQAAKEETPAVEIATDIMTGEKAPAFPGDEVTGFEASSPADRGDEYVPHEEPVKAEPEAEAKDEVTEPEVEAAKDEEAKDEEAKDEGAKDEEAAVEAEAAKDQVTKDEPVRQIPKSRFDQVNEKYKAARARLEQLEKEQEATEKGTEGTYDFDAKEAAYLEMVLDGKVNEAAALRKEIRAAERAQIEAEIDARSTQNVQRTTIATTLQEMSDDYASEFPGFNPESDAYDADAIDEVKALYTGYFQQSREPLVAFEKAVEAVVTLRGWNRPVPEPGAAPAKAQPSKPSAAQVKSKVELASKQPPTIGDKGQGAAALKTGDVDVVSLTEAELAALPAATRSRLRGDFL